MRANRRLGCRPMPRMRMRIGRMRQPRVEQLVQPLLITFHIITSTTRDITPISLYLISMTALFNSMAFSCVLSFLMLSLFPRSMVTGYFGNAHMKLAGGVRHILPHQTGYTVETQEKHVQYHRRLGKNPKVQIEIKYGQRGDHEYQSRTETPALWFVWRYTETRLF